MLLARFNKSALYRLFKIEVGGSTRAEIIKILREFKASISQSETIDIPKAIYNSKSQPIPYGGNVYIPTKNGKGDVSVDTVGGDMDLKEILDIEYYRNKLFAALKVSKAFLGDEEAITGGISNQSLVRLDIRYARTVKRCVTCLVRGMKEICDYYLTVQGREKDIPKYVICVPKIMTAEENDRSEAVNTDLNTATVISQLLEADEAINKHALNEYLITHVVGMDKLWEAIKDVPVEKLAEEE